jgi:hypothetical protein
VTGIRVRLGWRSSRVVIGTSAIPAQHQWLLR